MVHNPHDALVKAVLAHPEHARGVLQTVMPAALVEALDWTKLTLRPGNYVDVALREQFTDLLYSATWQGATRCSSTFYSSISPRPRRRRTMA